eukprot:scaffold23483_cov58-Phaeocystis_antarctica.AAC.1
MPSSRLSAGRVGVQPAAELRHLQRHDHAHHVRCALLPVPSPNLQSSPPLHAACTAVGRHLRLAGLHIAPHRTPFFRRSAVRVGVQPAAELRHLQRHNHEPHVPGVLLPVPCSESAVEPSPLHAACTAVTRRLATRQGTHFLSAANKRLIRCAWAGTSAFASAGYGSSWGPGSCTSPALSPPP